MKKTLIALLVLANVMQTNAFADDIYGKGDRYIKVTEYSSAGQSKNYVGFELCHKDHSMPCEQIGFRKYYSKAELVSLRNSEKKDVALAALADVGIVIVAVYGGAILGAVGTSAVAGFEGAAMVGASGGAVLGTAGSSATIAYVDAVNPAEQYRQVKVLSQDVLNDKDVVMKRDVMDIAHTLRSVLSNLD